MAKGVGEEPGRRGTLRTREDRASGKQSQLCQMMLTGQLRRTKQ